MRWASRTDIQKPAAAWASQRSSTVPAADGVFAAMRLA